MKFWDGCKSALDYMPTILKLSKFHQQSEDGIHMKKRIQNNVEFYFNGAQWICVSHDSIGIICTDGEWGVTWAGYGIKSADDSMRYAQALVAAAELAVKLTALDGK